MNKKILIITDNLFDQVNGVVTTYTNIKTQAKRHGYAVEFVDPSDFSHVDCPGYPEVKLSWPRGIGRKIQAANPDFVHIATEGPIGLAARIWLERAGWNYNTAYHTKWADFLNAIYCFPKFVTRAYLRWFHNRSSHILTTTETMVQDLKQHGLHGKIQSWTRGVDRSRLMPTVSHVGNAKPRILYVGRVSKEKSIDDLCRLSGRYQIVVVGDGPDRARLESQYPTVDFLGYKQGSELADQYIAADVFAFPSRVDTFGIVMIESMSLGTPVAAYPVSGPVDVVEHQINGFLDQDLGHAIDQCLLLDRQQVAKSADRWTWEQCWEIFEKYLVSVH